MKIRHHGVINGVSDSCQQLFIENNNSRLIDCGLFQGSEQSNEAPLEIDFDISTVRGLNTLFTN